MLRTTLGAILALIATASSAIAVETSTTASPVRQGPRPVNAASHGVGQLLPDASLVDLAGNPLQLSELAESHRVVVIAMTSTSCPLSMKYLPTLVELSQTSGDDVAWLIVNPIATDKLDAMTTAAERFEGAVDRVGVGPSQAVAGEVIYVHDEQAEFAALIGALTTTDVIVVDRSRTVVYHGAIDDQYGLGYSLEAPRQRYLADALTSIKSARRPLVVATEAPGCTLVTKSRPPSSPNLTYHNRISRIVQQNCITCHHAAGVAPFELTTLEDVRAHAGMIEQVVERGIMPPWFAADSDDRADDALSPWSNDRSLAQNDKRDLLSWLAGEMPAGDVADAPVPLEFESDWEIGTPDVIFQFDEPQAVKATGVMPYQDVDVQTDIAEDRWVQAIEIKPSERGVVHHVLVFAQGDGKAQDERTGFWGIYVPGNSALVYPDGFAKRLPKGAKLRFQMHYTPNGIATTDRTSIGLIFAKQPPQYEVRVAGIYNDKISIPAGAENHPEVASLSIPAEARLMGLLPHMHLRGKAARYELVSAGKTTTLLDVPRYDFNWQLLYRFRDPLPVQAGDTIRFTSWYDNSDNNPANPDPTKTVVWGPQTYDEMQVGYVEYYLPGAVPGDAAVDLAQAGDRGRRQKSNAALFRRLDVNGDGVITKAEVRQRMPNDKQAEGPIFDRLDEDHDGELTREELMKF